MPRRSLAFILVSISAAGLLAGCGPSDEIELPELTRSTVDAETAARIELCDAFASYVTAEERRAEFASDSVDLARRLEARRISALGRFETFLPPDSPSDVTAALDELRRLPFKTKEDPAAPTTTSAAPRWILIVTDHLDPTCDTIGGHSRDQSEPTLAGVDEVDEVPANTGTASDAPVTASDTDPPTSEEIDTDGS